MTNGKIKVLLYIETSGPGGAETVLVNLARHLDRSMFEPIALLHRSDWLHQQLQHHGIDTRIIPCNRSWDLSFLVKLVRLCRREKIDLIHSHLFGASLYASLAALVARVPVIATFHNELFLPGRKERYLRLKNFLIRNLVRKIALVADFMKKDYVHTGKYPENKILTIYNGLEFASANSDDAARAVRREEELSDDDLVIGHVANFRHPKGHHYLIEAAKIVCAAIPNARFLLIGEQGDGTIKAEVERLIGEYGLAGNIRLMGFRSDVSRLLQVMDIFVLPSLSEGHPLSIVEAMAASLPVVATNVGGLGEMVIDGRTGYLVQPKNPAQLAERLLELAHDANLRKDMGRVGQKTAAEKFSLERMLSSYQNLYKEIAGVAQ